MATLRPFDLTNLLLQGEDEPEDEQELGDVQLLRGASVNNSPAPTNAISALIKDINTNGLAEPQATVAPTTAPTPTPTGNPRIDAFINDINTNGLGVPLYEPPRGFINRALDTIPQRLEDIGRGEITRAESGAAASQAGFEAVASALERTGRNVFEAEQLRGAGERGAGEALLSVGSGLVGAGLAGLNFLTTSAIKSIADIGTPGDSQYFTRLRRSADSIAKDISFQPKSEVGQQLSQAITTPFEAIAKVSEYAVDNAPILNSLTPDQKLVVKELHLMATFYAGGLLFHAGKSALDRGIEKFQREYLEANKGTPGAVDRLVETSQELRDTIPGADTILETVNQVLSLDKVLATISPIFPQGIDPTLLRRLRNEGRDVLRRLNENPDTVQTQADAINDLLRTGQELKDAVPNADTILETVSQVSTLDDILATRSPILPPNIDPTLLPRLRNEGRDILRRLNENPDNVQTQADAVAFNVRTQSLNLDEIRGQIAEAVPSTDLGSSTTLTQRGVAPGEPAVPAFSPIELSAKEKYQRTLDSNTPKVTQTELLRQIKIEAGEVAGSARKVDQGLGQLGFTPDEVAVLSPQLKGVRAARKGKSAPKEPTPLALDEALPERVRVVAQARGRAQADIDAAKTPPERVIAQERLRRVDEEATAPRSSLEDTLLKEPVVDGTPGIRKPRQNTPTSDIDAAINRAVRNTDPVGPETINKIRKALEDDIDITSELEPRVQPHFERLRQQARAGLDDSDFRNARDILGDLLEIAFPTDRGTGSRFLSGEQGGLRFGLTPNQRSAARRLQADAIKKQIDVIQALREAGIPEVERRLFASYLASRKAPSPPAPMVRLDANDPSSVVRQRSFQGTKYVPLFENEVNMIQSAFRKTSANFIEALNAITGLEVPYYVARDANILPIHYAGREVYRTIGNAVKELNQDLKSLSRDVSMDNRKRIGQYAYEQHPDNTPILSRQGITSKVTLDANEAAVYNAGIRYVQERLKGVEEGRKITGQKPLPREVYNNIPAFMRAFTLSQKLDKGLNLLYDTPPKIVAALKASIITEFPNTVVVPGLKGFGARAVRTSEFDFFNNLQNTTSALLKQTYEAPFLAKINELINHPLPNPVNGHLDWYLKNHNPALHEYLNNWRTFLVTGSNLNIPKSINRFMQITRNNLAYGLLTGSLRTAGVQFGALRGAYLDTGLKYTVEGLGDTLVPTKRAFALEHSEVLDSRLYRDTVTNVSSAIIGRSVKDFVGAIKEGRIGDVQRAVGAPGFKLLELADMQAAIATWHAGYRQATQKLGLSGRDAYRHADDTVLRGSGGNMPIDIAAIQRNELGQLGTQFQRFALNEWNFLTKDVLGVKNIDRLLESNPEATVGRVVKQLVNYATVTTAFNILFEDVLPQLGAGVNTPFPTPLRNLEASINRNDTLLQTLGSVASSFLEPIPILSPIRFGKGIGGPGLDTFRDFSESLQGDPTAYRIKRKNDSTAEAALRVFGSPGANLLGLPYGRATRQFLRGQERGQNVVESLSGFYPGEQQKGGGFDLPSLPNSGGLRRLR